MPAGPRVSPGAVASGRLDAVRAAAGARAVILVEGVSDQAAVETLAGRCGRDLAGAGVAVLPMGGATSIGHYLALPGPGGLNLGHVG